MSRSPRIIFIGTPEFALPTLRVLIDRFLVVGVVTQPDRPAGRGRPLQAPPVKQVAVAHDIPVFQPQSLRTREAIVRLGDWAPEVIATVATGHILTADVLRLPKHGTLNVHASLLPRWRGAAPLQAAILAGDTQTGVTIMCTDEGLDTGPILAQAAIPIDPRETGVSLHDKLAQLGADLLVDTLPRWLSGALAPKAQPVEGVTVADRVRKDDGLIHWERSALEIDRQVRAYHPWPGAFTFWEEQRLKLIAAYPLEVASRLVDREKETALASFPGTVLAIGNLPAVVSGAGWLRLDQVQLAGKRALSGADFMRGRPEFIGARLGTG